jgi:hypothetical protein
MVSIDEVGCKRNVDGGRGGGRGVIFAEKHLVYTIALPL